MHLAPRRMFRVAAEATGLWACLAWTGVAMAQAIGTLEVTFAATTDAAVGVPLSPWVAIASSVAVSIVALLMFRHRRPSTFAKLIIVGVSLAMGVGSGMVLRDVGAVPIPPIPLPLTTSPTSIALTTIPRQYLATNQTGGPIKITGAHVVTPYCIRIATPPTTCTYGGTMAPGQSCILGVQEAFDPCPPG
jgi:hypothetical protein